MALDCCLDVEWLDDSTFASCGADSNIHILNVHDAAPLKTLMYVPSCSPPMSDLIFYCLDTVAIIMKSTKLDVIRRELDWHPVPMIRQHGYGTFPAFPAARQNLFQVS
jgi:hypothetical protein